MAAESDENKKSEKEDKSSDAEHLFVYASAKAGMDEVDKTKIQETIYSASKGSAYFENEQRKAAQVEEKMKSIKKRLKQISDEQIEQMQVQCNKYLQQIDCERDLCRTWIHCDMDMFYAAVAIRDNPILKDKPIAIGSMSMISTTNYIARKYGVRAAMPGFIGKKLCPQLLFVKHNWSAYKQASNKVREIVAEYDPNFTAASLDEVYLDITDYLEEYNNLNENKDKQINGGDVALEIRDKIYNATKLTASAGIACNRMLSKIGSDMNKPNGQFLLESDSNKIKEFMKTLNVRKVPGIGRVTQRILKEIGIKTCLDVLSKAALVQLFFKQTTYQWLLSSCYGIATNKRDPNEIYQRKSISQERTFNAKGISNEKELEKRIIEICNSLCDEILEKKIRGKTITVKLKTTEFETKTRAHSIGFYTNDKTVIINNALQILRKEYPIKLRLLGVRMSGLEQKKPQSKLQKQLNDFWSVKKINDNNKMEIDDGDGENVENELKELMIDDDDDDKEEEEEMNMRRKRKRNWNDMMKESEGDDIDDLMMMNKKRKKISTEIETRKKRMTLSQMFANYKSNEKDDDDDDDEDEDIDINTNNLNGNEMKKRDKMTLSQMFEKQEKKNKVSKQQKYICPICDIFECVSNLQLNHHLDLCLQKKTQNQKKKKKKTKQQKKTGKTTLTQFFRQK